MTGWRARLEALPRATVTRAAGHFGLDPASLQPIRTGANAIWRADADAGTVALRINHVDLRGAARFALAVAWQAWLARPGGGAADVVPTPLRDPVGRLVLTLRGGWLASACAWAPGEPVGHRCDDPAVYRAWGAALARLHGAAEGFPVVPVAPWYHWQEERAGIEVPLDDPELLAAWRAFAPRLAALPVAACGLTHGDQNAGNAIRDAGGAIRLVDHDEPMWGWPLADLVRPLAERLGSGEASWQAIEDALFDGWAAGGGALPDDAREQAEVLLAFKLWNGLLWQQRLQAAGVPPLPGDFLGDDPAAALALPRAAVLGVAAGIPLRKAAGSAGR